MSAILPWLLMLSGAPLTPPEGALLGVIPRPAKVMQTGGEFRIAAETRILVEGDSQRLDFTARWLAELLRRGTRYEIPVERWAPGGELRGGILLTTTGAAEGLGPEGYELSVAPEGARIRGPQPAGVFYGVQTLRQLLPPAIESSQPPFGLAWTIPCCEIEDRPRFAWRGMHLDVARHFFDKQFVQRYIDYIAAYKINKLHLYLTDDQGWRIEIKRYPKLTEVGAWRRGTWQHKVNGAGDNRRYGGCFTQEDLREIVHYAQDRSVTVVPAISMPGHSQAALAAYPQLSSTGGPFEVWTRWGISKEVMDPGKEEVFEFLDGVLSEVAELFPSPYIHCGGDEVPRDRWRESPYAQSRIQSENLKDEDGLQNYFSRRVQRILELKGKQLIGWEEILLGGSPPSAVVMSWRNKKAELAAVRAGRDVIMVPNRETYFNYRPTADPNSPGHSAVLPLRTVYDFEPVPAELSPTEAKHILGAQACLWTEYIPTPDDAEYLLFPRICALAEVVWSPRDLRQWDDFRRRVGEHLKRLDQWGVRYGVGEEL